MKEKAEKSEVVKRALTMLHSRPELVPRSPVQEAQEEGEAKPQAITPEALAASILAENQPGEVGEILRVWKKTFGMDLDRERVARHLEGLTEWKKKWARG